jgi:hypothetical protein
MTIPLNPAVPNLPLAPDPYTKMWMDQYSSVLRLYFNQINASTTATISQVSTNQTLVWLGV